MKIALFFNKQIEGTIGIYFERALKALGFNFQHFWAKDALTAKPEFDFYLRIDDGDYQHDLGDNLHPCAFYVVDTIFRNAYRRIKKQVSHYDFVFCVERHAAREFRKGGINSFWLPLACDPQVHAKLDLPKRYDIGFVGNDGGVPRKFILQELRERYPASFIGRAAYTEMGRIYSQAKIGFHLIVPHIKSCSPMSMRFFEITSCGTMLLANQVRAEDLAALGFKNRENLVLYNNLKEIFPLIEYYLRNEREREEIAERGRRLALARHTYKKRMEQMLDIISAKQ